MVMLNQSYTLSEEQIRSYRENNYIKLKNVLSPEEVIHFNQVISAKVSELNRVDVPLDERDTYGKAFLQLFNLCFEDDKIKDLVFSKRLAQIATDLMGVSGVRLYHDQALFKEGGGGITPWHADQFYWPLANDHTITAWIPLQHTPLEMGPLEFSAGSQRIVEGRDLKIGDESEQMIHEKLRVTDFEHVIEPFDLGEVSFHSGWVFHRAGANKSKATRKVMTVIYMDKDMRLKNPENENQTKDWNAWCPGAEIGEIIDTPKNPILYAN
jgi:ectoine hydroxylase-related dioxygenase (phytanoyl-CoA dioxygenase family)